MRSDGRDFDSAEKPPATRAPSTASARVPFASSPREAPYAAAAPLVSYTQQQRASRDLHPSSYNYGQQQQWEPPPHQYQQQPPYLYQQQPPPAHPYEQQRQRVSEFRPHDVYTSQQQHQQQQQQQQQQPLLAYYPPTGERNVCVQVKPRCASKTRVLVQMLQLAGFHALNAALGFTAFSLLSTGVGSSISLLPLCCVGIIVFRVVLYGVHVLAELDVMLANFASPPGEKILLEVPVEPTAARNYVLAPSLEHFSPLSLLALLYFLSVKFGFAVLSAISVAMAVLPMLLLLAAICGAAESLDFEVGSSRFSYKNDSAAFLVAAACVSVIGCALMVFVVKASKSATRFFCCEPLETLASRASPPQPMTVVTANFSYGST